MIITPPLRGDTVTGAHNGAGVTVEPLTGHGPVQLVVCTSEAVVYPEAVVIIPAQHPVLHPPPVPVIEPPSCMTPVDKSSTYFSKLNR